ncbi:hypothetical protein MG293_002189 [Ovis ammon polii]|uniref:Uncharacterized protein n=1 Tax=Ovis ammon polii TaxID=230172 RepID=A0AAD4US17_OVIAM|nr:hypothetical protein MG293_002189 [Ovis ammon polii]
MVRWLAAGEECFVYEKRRLRDTTEVTQIADSATKGSPNTETFPLNVQQDTWKKNSSPTFVFIPITILNGVKRLLHCRKQSSMAQCAY